MRYLDYKGAAALMHRPVGTVQWLVHQKRIPHLRLGPRSVLFDEDDLREWLASMRVAPNVATGYPVEVPLRRVPATTPNTSPPLRRSRERSTVKRRKDK